MTVISKRHIGMRLLFVVLALIAGSSVRVLAQTSQAVIRGTVADSSGAIIQGATLKLENTMTHVVTTTTTNDTGLYLFPNLNPGTYTLEATTPGFKVEKLKPFVLQVNQTATLDLALTVGQVTQVVEVQAEGEGVEASTTELGLTLGSRQMEDLPLNGRAFTSLVLTAPGVSSTVVSGSQSGNYTTGTGGVLVPSINGFTNRSDIFVVDGILNNETFGDAYAVEPIIDAVQDMKVQSHNDSAEFGGSLGGTVNISTKSGTNDLHGAAWEYNLYPTLQALTYFAAPGANVPPTRQNQFGGDFGGPVVIPWLYNGRNKTFFFGSWESYIYNSPTTAYYLVPTAAELSGNFTADVPIYDPTQTTCTSAGVCSRPQFSYNGVLNVIPPSRVNQGAVYYAQNALPPSIGSATLPGGNNASQVNINHQSLKMYDYRFDENIGAKNTVYFRMMGIFGPQTTGRVQDPTSVITHGFQYVGSYEHVFNPTTILHVQGGRTLMKRNKFQDFASSVPSDLAAKVGWATGLVSGYFNNAPMNPGFEIDNHISDTGEVINPATFGQNWSLKSDFTKVIGRHTLKTGVEYNSIGEKQDYYQAWAEMRAQETNSLQDSTSGNAAASFVIGVPGVFKKRNVVESLSWGGIISFYAQDTFQISSKLTLNVGYRQDLVYNPPFGRPQDQNQYTGGYNFRNGTYVVFKVPPSCAVAGQAPCIPGGVLPANVVASTDGARVFQNQYLTPQPRVGIAYRLNPKTALRAGVGVTYDEYAGVVQNTRGYAGNWPSITVVNPSNINAPTAATPWPGYTIANLPDLTPVPAATPFTTNNYFVDPLARIPRAVEYNLGVQRQLSPSTVVSAAYVGSESRHLQIGSVYNVAETPGSGTPSARAPYPYISPTTYSWNGGNGSYNSLQLQLDRYYSNGLAATIAYTHAKSIDEGCSGYLGTESCTVQQVYAIRTAERGVSTFDLSNNLVVTENYELPVGRGKLVDVQNPVLDAVAGGWHINSSAFLRSGVPYTVTISTDVANIGQTGYERPNITGNPMAAQHTLKQWFNTAAFSTPTLYTFGNMGRNSLRTPFYQSYNLGVFKELKYHERYSMRLNLESFNFLNHKIFAQPNSSYGTSAFGAMSSTATASRTVQASVKLAF